MTSLNRLVFALPDDGLPFAAIHTLHRRMLWPEQTGEWLWVSITRSMLRELVRQKRVTFRNGRYFRTVMPNKAPRPLYIPMTDQFTTEYPEVSYGPWKYGL